ncbi:dynein axonemal intermediate chain 7 homolog [Octopus bimaculoides]|uniref:IC97/Casc1 N-terminal domain-containing protein n=1 Tax=Octopus bimaculoides TaxID=37653 RepID=A0A0L8HBC7_OCTBM|nr:dynein axonemal intermediate chain 7 homolog [Octopus bimaculoides]|eukprot:XP_014774165.1 PREDICTED: axonemal 84 kDa protein-like [Octopus bimaculoides]
MGPKKKKKKDHKKEPNKASLTSKDTDSKEKEELEKKTNEEEETLRVQAEKEEAERKKFEKIRLLELKRQEIRERKQRVEELREIEEMTVEQERYFKDLLWEKRKLERWERFMRCDGTPDPMIQKEINTYISLSLEDDKNNDIETVLENSLLNLALIEELNNFIDLATQTEPFTEHENITYQNIIKDLQNLLEIKLNASIHNCLLGALQNIDPETSNYQAYHYNECISVCIWGNLSKNLRIKSYEFKEFGFSFDIPKVLALTDCAVALLYTAFDHLSEQCATYKVTRKTSDEPVVETKEEKPEEEPVPEPPPPEEEAAPDPLEDISAALQSLKFFDDPVPEGPKRVDVKKAEEEDVAEYPFPQSPAPVEYEEFDEDPDVVDLRCYQVVSGIFTISLLYLPPQPKLCGKWTITQVVPTELCYMDYVADPPLPTESKESGEEGEQKKEKEASVEQKRDERPLIGITLRIPPNVVLSECPRPVRWDNNRKVWSIKDICDYKYNDETKSVQFKTNSFGKFALIQDSYINMPFQSWEIRPRTTNWAVFTITAAVLEVVIEIKDGLCCIIKHPEEGLSHLFEKWYKPKELINRLTLCGVALFPAEDSTNYVSIQEKSFVTEERCYHQMALVASCMAFTWSRWNFSAERHQLILQGVELLEDEEVCDDWELYLVTKTHVMKLKLDEFDDIFSTEVDDDYQYFSNFYHLVKETGSEEAIERLKKTTPEFRDCVKQMLTASRVLTYS